MLKNNSTYFFTDESLKRQITNSISENLTDSDLESRNDKQKLVSNHPIPYLT